MDRRPFTVVPPSKKSPWKPILFLVSVIIILAVGGYFVSKRYSIQSIEVSGNYTYSTGEVITYIEQEMYIPNTLAMIVENRILHLRYLPFVEEVTMSLADNPHVLHVEVKERLRAGVFQYGEKQIYFDEDGIALESRNKLFDGVPVVEGVPFSELVLGNVIPAESEYFQIIVAITKKIATYNLEVTTIEFDGLDDIMLYMKNYDISLGDSKYLEEKMSRLPGMTESLQKNKQKGVINLSRFTPENPIITFKKYKK